ncbi:MarR family winged helix-turn-helix transcriptional regulator [Dactylosporangium maewongense]|uniref:MarR family winged helix-turn-helix transcriptional regulator n=1 Tax=Dactylosporangium maewongense TaxID=634393 RepID=A0ABN2CRT0_9ACTN
MTTKRTRTADALTDLIIDLLKLNGPLVTAGDRMVAQLGLTSTRWQVLRAIIDAERAQPVAWLARDMGGNRQNVQRIVNDLQEMGFVTLEENPHHRRASLVVLTDKGRRTYAEASRLQAPWANGLSEDLAIKDIDTTRRVLAELRKKLELNDERAST